MSVDIIQIISSFLNATYNICSYRGQNYNSYFIATSAGKICYSRKMYCSIRYSYFNAKQGYIGLAIFRPILHQVSDMEDSTTDMDTLRYFDLEDQTTGRLPCMDVMMSHIS